MNNEIKADKVKEWGVLPDAAVLRRLRNQGMTYKEIAELYGVTESGVWRAFDRADLIKSRPTYRNVVPWKVDRKFSQTAIMKHLRTMAKMQAELPVGHEDERSLTEWLDDMQRDNVILAYHVDAPPNAASEAGGFYYTERNPDEQGWFRE